MKFYLLSLSAGILVGVVYSLLGVKSPAPPIIALIGLLGILIGEQAVPLGKRVLTGRPAAAMISTNGSTALDESASALSEGHYKWPIG